MEVTESICTVFSGLAGCPLNYGSSPILLEKRGQDSREQGPGFKGQDFYSPPAPRLARDTKSTGSSLRYALARRGFFTLSFLLSGQKG